MKNHCSLYFFVIVFAFANLPTTIGQHMADMENYIEDQNLSVKRADNGIAYIVDKKSRGKKAKPGDYVLIHYKGTRLDGYVFDESPEKDGFVYQVGHRQVIQGLDQGIQLLSPGEKAQLFIPADLAYRKQGVGDIIKPGMDLRYEVELVKIMSEKEYDQYIISLEEKERKAYERHVRTQFINDKKAIQEYALAHKLKTKRAPSGLSYIITKKGKGDLAVPGDILEVEYEGVLTDDTLFDTSPENNVHTFKLGIGKVIPGWEEGLTFFNQGAEGYLFVPSKLAYGPRAIVEADTNIPANSVLIFKIKLNKITKAQKRVMVKSN